jgi:pyruvate/2-oxoglutarate dehydrogenase complex dihydrolipoamide acyltransferase (E2) component
MTERGYDEAAAKRAVISTFPHLRQLRQEGSAPDAFTNPRVILWMVDQILAPAMTAATAPPTSAQPAAPAEEQPPVPPTPTVPNPPGSKRPASLQARTPTESPLRAEQEEVRRSLAAEFGVDPQRLIDRAKARGGRRGR